MEYNKNIIITLILSGLILVSWDYFFPHQQPAKVQPQIAITQTLEQPKEQPHIHQQKSENHDTRININTAKLEGSINLTGAVFDDLRLKKYHVTADKDSAEITILSPKNSNSTYLAEFGYLSDPSLGEMPNNNSKWKLIKGDILTETTPITLQFTNSKGITFERDIAIDSAYLFTITDKILNNSNNVINLRSYGRLAREDIANIDKDSSYLLHEGPIGVFADNNLAELSYKKLRSEKEKSFRSAPDGWFGITDKYWATAIIPTNNRAYRTNFTYVNSTIPNYQTDYLSDPINIDPKQELILTTKLFAGAKEVNVIDNYKAEFNLYNFDLLIDWGWFKFLTKPLFYLMDYFSKLTSNFGLAIILTTLVIKIFLFPLSNKSYRSMARMRELQPRIKAIQERYPDDLATRNRETMTLYKQEKVNPLAGCWPMLIQFPIFFSIYKVLYISIEMRHAPFFGWIKDLSAPDPTSVFNLFGLLPYDVPSFLMIGAWPIIMGITMFMQMKMTPTTLPASQAFILNLMPIMLTFVMAGFPAGLVIYWATNNILTILQQMIAFKPWKNKKEKI